LGSGVLLYSRLDFFRKGLEKLLSEKVRVSCFIYSENTGSRLSDLDFADGFSVAILHLIDYQELLKQVPFFANRENPLILLIWESGMPIVEKVYQRGNAIALLESIGEDELLKVVKHILRERKADITRIEKSYPEISSKILKSSRLTPREVEILYFMAKGMTSYSISLVLNVSVHTVRNHINRIYEKLGVNDRVSAVMKAFSLGLLSDKLR
jgi:DNA-binding NarL/FixJ family response regulator